MSVSFRFPNNIVFLRRSSGRDARVNRLKDEWKIRTPPFLVSSTRSTSWKSPLWMSFVLIEYTCDELQYVPFSFSVLTMWLSACVPSILLPKDAEECVYCIERSYSVRHSLIRLSTDVVVSLCPPSWTKWFCCFPESWNDSIESDTFNSSRAEESKPPQVESRTVALLPSGRDIGCGISVTSARSCDDRPIKCELLSSRPFKSATYLFIFSSSLQQRNSRLDIASRSRSWPDSS